MNRNRRAFLGLARPMLWLGFGPALGPVLAAAARAQGMLAGVDLSSPAFTQAELSRAEVEALIEKRGAGAALDLSDKSLNGLDLSKLDLAGANLRGARLNHANLAGANLGGAQLDQIWALAANFSGADLSRAKLFGSQLQGARMDRANFAGARLAGDFTGASLVEADLSEANASADMKNQSMGLMRAIFRSADLTRANFTRANLAHVDLEFAKLNGANFSGADLSGADASGADLRGANLSGANVAGLDVASARIDAAQAATLAPTLNLDRALTD